MRLPHSLELEEVYKDLDTSEDGLSEGQARARLKEFGYNELKVKGQPFWKKIVEPFRSVFILILVAAAGLSYLSGERIDSAIIGTIIAINAAIFYTQQHATSRVLRTLKKHSEQFVQTLRGAKPINEPATLLVPGDVILLSEGQKVPADSRIIHSENLFLDESALTGESLPIAKSSAPVSADKPLYERTSMVFSGTYVVSGTGTAVVVATGSATEFGSIAKLATQEEPKSPVQEKIDGLVSRLIKILVAVGLFVYGLSLLRGIPESEALRFVMSMTVAAVPEDLPIALSVIVVLGMRRMAKKKALVRSFKAIEDIGLVTTIATDKTGTLTKNNLKVSAAWSVNSNLALKEVCLKALGDSMNVIEPFDKALKEFAGQTPENFDELVKNYPFNQSQRMSGAVWAEGKKNILYIKGAPEHLLSLSDMEESHRHDAQSELGSLVSKGYRVIATARTTVKKIPDDLSKAQAYDFEFLGFIAFADELRADSKQAIDDAHSAGISVKMITGDHFETAFHIGQTLGIGNHRDQVIIGSDLPESENQLAPVAKSKSIFARILPEQKFNILRALKRSEITAMTGDGVNDVPALANANIGIAMGSGSDIAKDAGDIVLLNNSFAAIVKAISEGRVIYENIRRMLFYLLSTTLGEIITMIGALLVGLPLPVTAIQILWINLVTDTALVIPLGLEPPEEDHMKKPPRRPKDPILDRILLHRIVLVGAAMAISTLIVFGYLINEGYSSAYAQTIAFMMLVVAQWVNAFNARSERFSVLRRARVPNYKLLVGLSLAATAQALVMFGPLRDIFNIQPVELGHLLVGITIVSLAVYVTSELHKFWQRTKKL